MREKLNERVYQLRNVRVVDGDTIRADIMLGFGMAMVDRLIRMSDINAPETHTRNLLEKEAGIAVSDWLKDRLDSEPVELVTDVDDEYGKFGRPLGCIRVSGVDVCAELLELEYAHGYEGGTKVKFTDEELREILGESE